MSDNSEAVGKTKIGLQLNDRHLAEFLENTTINGLVYVFRGRSKIRRIMWGIIFVGATIGCIALLSLSIQRFVSKPTATTVVYQTTELGGTRFPAVTVCNVNSSHTLRGFRWLLYQLFDPMQTFDENELNTSTRVDQCNDRLDTYRNRPNIGQDIWNFVARFENTENLIHYCGYSENFGKLIRCEKEFVPVLTPSGLCFTFNSIKSSNGVFIRRTGAWHGLKLILKTEKKDEYDFEESAVKVIIHDRKDIARPTLYGIGVPVGMNAIISVVRKHSVDETSETGCRQNTKLEFLPDIVYSQFACIQDAIIRQIAEECKCILSPARPVDGQFVNMRNCTFLDSCCMLREYHTFEIDDANCPLPCVFNSYDHHISYTSGVHIQNNVNISTENDYLSVHIFMEDLQTVNSITQYTYGADALLADFGGHMGLFLGISIISILEVIVLILDKLKQICITKKIKAKIDAVDGKLKLPEIVHVENGIENNNKDNVNDNGKTE